MPGQEKVRIAESGDHVVTNIQRPSITYYPAEKGKVRIMRTLPEMGKGGDKVSGRAMIIAPGGGHAELWIDHEGYRPAQWFSRHGVAAFVLKYRLAEEPGSHYSVDVEALADIQGAIRFVRSHAAAWGTYKGIGVSAELHIYGNIGHGFGPRDSNKGGYAEWPQRLLDWMYQLPRSGGNEEYRRQ